MNKQDWYIKYFDYMQEENKKIPLGGMAWDDLSYHANEAIKQKIFTIRELKERWPHLWGHLKDDDN